MGFQVPQFWDIAGDGLQILLYLLMLGFYIKNRAIHKRYAVNRTKNGRRQSFNAQVFNITVEQQVNQAFTNIIETIAAERNGLKSVLGLNTLNKPIFRMQPNSQLPKNNDNHRISDDRTGRAGRHEKVRKLIAKGLSVRKISEGLKIPMGEVELILSLQRK